MDLEVTIIGTEDRLYVDDWFVGSDIRLDFEAGDGQSLLEAGVQNLVDAMAVFDPPNVGELELPAGTSQSIIDQIAVSWD